MSSAAASTVFAPPIGRADVCPWHRWSTSRNCQFGNSAAIRCAKLFRFRREPRMPCASRQVGACCPRGVFASTFAPCTISYASSGGGAAGAAAVCCCCCTAACGGATPGCWQRMAAAPLLATAGALARHAHCETWYALAVAHSSRRSRRKGWRGISTEAPDWIHFADLLSWGQWEVMRGGQARKRVNSVHSVNRCDTAAPPSLPSSLI